MAKKRLLFIGDSITDCGHLWDFHEKALGDGYVRLISEYMERLDPDALRCPPLCALGRQSLPVYMLHQPIVYGVLLGGAALLGR